MPQRTLLPGPGAGRDRVFGFAPGEDRIEVSAARFGDGLRPGLDLGIEDRFVAGPGAAATAPDGLGQFTYDTTTGLLAWDANGAAEGGRAALAVLAGAPALSASDLAVIA